MTNEEGRNVISGQHIRNIESNHIHIYNTAVRLQASMRSKPQPNNGPCPQYKTHVFEYFLIEMFYQSCEVTWLTMTLRPSQIIAIMSEFEFQNVRYNLFKLGTSNVSFSKTLRIYYLNPVLRGHISKV